MLARLGNVWTRFPILHDPQMCFAAWLGSPDKTLPAPRRIVVQLLHTRPVRRYFVAIRHADLS